MVDIEHVLAKDLQAVRHRIHLALPIVTKFAASAADSILALGEVMSATR